MQGLGYRGDIGYHTFLYSNDVELRRVFMFLVDRLPKEHSDSAAQSLGNDLHLSVLLCMCFQPFWSLAK